MLSQLAAARRQLLLLPARGASAVAYRSSSSSSSAAAVHGAVAPAPASASVLPDTLDRGSDAYQRNAAAVGGLLTDLRVRVSQVLRGGGAEAVRRNAARGKLLPRDRIDRLLDPGASFLEHSQTATVDWMNNCMICYIERDLFASIEDDKILNRFQGLRNRRMNLPRKVPSIGRGGSSGIGSSGVNS